MISSTLLIASEEVQVTIELPEGVSVNYNKLKVYMFTKNGRKIGKSIQVNPDLSFTFPLAYDVGMLQVRKKSTKANHNSTMFLAAEVNYQQSDININALTTIRAMISRDIQGVYSTINDSEKHKAEPIILSLLNTYKKHLEESMRSKDYSLQNTAQNFSKEAEYKEKVKAINSALLSAIDSGVLDTKTLMPVSEVQSVFEELISCQETPLTLESNSEKTELFRDVMKNEFQRSETGHLLKRKLQLFDANVTQVFPGSVGTSPGFAAILEADIQSLRLIIEARGVDLTQCTNKGCEIEINETASLLMSDSAMFTGLVSKNKPSTILGCIYPYVP